MHIPTGIVAVVAATIGVLGCVRDFPETLDPFASDWYSGQLRAAGEARLSPTRAPQREVYRFTWIPSFHPTVTVRVTRNSDSITLVANRLTGAGGYEAGRVGTRKRRELPVQHWRVLKRLVGEAGFWSMESNEPVKVTEDGGIVVGADGAQWLLEGADQSRYHFVDRWFHQDYPSFERACLCLLVWSELDIAEDLDGYGTTLPTEQECSQ